MARVWFVILSFFLSNFQLSVQYANEKLEKLTQVKQAWRPQKQTEYLMYQVLCKREHSQILKGDIRFNLKGENEDYT